MPRSISAPVLGKPSTRANSNTPSQSIIPSANVPPPAARTPQGPPIIGSYLHGGEDYVIQSKRHSDFLEVFLPVPLAEQYQCHCGFTAENHNSFKAHLKNSCLKEDVDPTFFCDYCQEKCTSLREAKKHVRDTHVLMSKELLVESGKSVIEDKKFSDRSLGRVKKRGRLDDEVIDFAMCAELTNFMESISGACQVFSLSAQFIVALEKFSNGSTFGQNGFPAWAAHIPRIYLPINHDPKGFGHWTLLVFDQVSKEIRHYDSLPDESNEKTARWAAETLSSFVEDRYGSENFKSLKFCPRECPKQDDGVSCGIHVILNAKADLHKEKPSCSQFDCDLWRAGFPAMYQLNQRVNAAANMQLPQQSQVQQNVPVTSQSDKIAAANMNSNSAFCNLAHRSKVKIIRRIPKASRITVARKLTEVVKNCVKKKDQESWRHLFSFAHSCLKIPHMNKKEKKNLASVINAQVQHFDGTCSCNEKASAGKGRKKKRGEKKLREIVSEKLSDGDIKGAVRVATSKETIAPNDEQTKAALLAKHPPQPSDLSLPPEPDKSSVKLQVTKVDVAAALQSFPNGSSAGLDGLRPIHLKDLTAKQTGQAGTDLLSAITDLINLLLRGDLPAWGVGDFFGANLCAFTKPNGGIRPIAVGSTFRRLAGKLANRTGIAEVVETDLRPHQVGCGVKYGAEGAAHSLRYFLTNATPSNAPTAVLKVDFANAFNTVRRDQVLAIVREKVPDLYPFIWQSYSSTTRLHYQDETLESATGVQQGDPLGPLLFCLAIQPIVDKCLSPFNCWYLDDGTLGGCPQIVLQDLKMIKKEAALVGLDLNFRKCELFLTGGTKEERQKLLAEFAEEAPGIELIHEDALVLLGAPIMEESIDRVLKQKLETLETLAETLAEVDPHDALFLLKNCFAIPKLLYFLRAAPCHQSQVLDDYDRCLKDCLESLLNIPVDGRTWEKACLPVRHGGLGVRSAKEISVPAYISSCVASKDVSEAILGETVPQLPGLEVALKKWDSAAAPNPALNRDSIAFPKSQRAWDDPICQVKASNLLSTAATDEERACLLAAMSQYSGSWLNSMPIPSLGLKLDPSTIRIAVSLRLGLRVCQPGRCELCGEQIGGKGHHGLSCRKSAGRQSRHATVNNLICRALVSAGIPARMEPQGTFSENRQRPDGMSLVPWRKGKPVAWDFTCCDTLAPSHLGSSKSNAGKVAEQAEERKKKLYLGLSSTFEFMPVCVETLGVWGRGALYFIKQIGRKVEEEQGDKRGTSFLIQAISLSVQRGNAASIMGSLPSIPDLDSLYNP